MEKEKAIEQLDSILVDDNLYKMLSDDGMRMHNAWRVANAAKALGLKTMGDLYRLGFGEFIKTKNISIGSAASLQHYFETQFNLDWI